MGQYCIIVGKITISIQYGPWFQSPISTYNPAPYQRMGKAEDGQDFEPLPLT